MVSCLSNLLSYTGIDLVSLLSLRSTCTLWLLWHPTYRKLYLFFMGVHGLGYLVVSGLSSSHDWTNALPCWSRLRTQTVVLWLLVSAWSSDLCDWWWNLVLQRSQTTRIWCCLCSSYSIMRLVWGLGSATSDPRWYFSSCAIMMLLSCLMCSEEKIESSMIWDLKKRRSSSHWCPLFRYG